MQEFFELTANERYFVMAALGVGIVALILSIVFSRDKGRILIDLLSRFSLLLIFSVGMGALLFFVGQKKSAAVTDNVKEDMINAIATGHLKWIIEDGSPTEVIRMLGRVIEGHTFIEKNREINLQFGPGDTAVCINAFQFVKQQVYNPSDEMETLKVVTRFSAFQPPCEAVNIQSVTVTFAATGDTIYRNAESRHFNSDNRVELTNIPVNSRSSVNVLTEWDIILNESDFLSHTVDRPVERLRVNITDPLGMGIRVEYFHPESETKCNTIRRKGGELIELSMDAPLLPGNGFQLVW